MRVNTQCKRGLDPVTRQKYGGKRRLFVPGNKVVVRWPYRKRVYRRTRSAPFYDKGILDEMFDPLSGIGTDVPFSDYFCLPALGQGPGERHGRRIKLYSINLDGIIKFEGDNGSTQTLSENADVGMSESSEPRGIGVGCIYVVLDREPSNVSKPGFDDVFVRGEGEHVSRVGVHVRPDVTSRFTVLCRETFQFCHAPVGGCVVMKRFIPLKYKRIISSFRDRGTEVRGSYSNCKENCPLIFCVWESRERCRISINVNSRIVYYH